MNTRFPSQQRPRTLVLCTAALVLLGACAKNEPGPQTPPSNPGTGGRRSTGGSGGNASGGTSGSGGSASGGSTGSGGAPGSGGSSPIDVGGDSPSETGGDGASAMALVDDPLGTLPTNLKDTGVFPDFPSMDRSHARAFRFAPRYPLYSNGLDKARFLVLPAGKQIDSSIRDAWEFPVGTLLFKTFSFKDPSAGGKERPVETRLIRRKSAEGKVTEQWEFAIWEWNETGTTATLIERERFLNPIPRKVSVGGESFDHRIPDLTMCWNCHIANRSPVIGFDELRLNAKLTPNDASTQLEQVVANKWLTVPPAMPLAEVKGGRTPIEQSVLEYFTGNCAHCHNGVETPLKPGSRYPQLDLRYDQVVRQTVGVRTMTVGTASGVRVVPKDPVNSVLLRAMKAVATPLADPEVKPMPLVGVDHVDAKALMMVEQWIRNL